MRWLDQGAPGSPVRRAHAGGRAGLRRAGDRLARPRHHGDDRDVQRRARRGARSVSLQGRRQPDEHPRRPIRRAAAQRTYYTTDQYLEFARRATIFDGVIASTISDVIWTGAGDPQRLRGNHITTTTFDVMGVPPLLGRAVRPADGVPGAEPVVVLGFKFWQRQFGGEASVLGRQLLLNGVNRTVVGVMPKRFMWRGADVYVPVVFEQGKVVEGVRNVHVLGRLKAGRDRGAGRGRSPPDRRGPGAAGARRSFRKAAGGSGCCRSRRRSRAICARRCGSCLPPWACCCSSPA